MDTRRVVMILEKVKDNLAVGQTDQKKPAQHNKVSTSAAKAKLKELETKSKAGRGKGNEIKATGASRK